MKQHYEWVILGPDGTPLSGTYTTGPWSPRSIIADGGYTEQDVDVETGEPRWDGDGEPIMVLRRPLPDGCTVGRRVVTYGDWHEASDNELSPPPPAPVGPPMTVDDLTPSSDARIAAALVRFDADLEHHVARIGLISVELQEWAAEKLRMEDAFAPAG